MEGIWGEMGVGEELGKAGQRDRGMGCRTDGAYRGEGNRQRKLEYRAGKCGDQEEVCSVSAD